MLIDIVGYVTKTNGENGFTIKVTSENTGYPPLNNIQASKEVEVRIDKYRYPADNDNVFERVSGTDNYGRDRIDKCCSLSDALRPGDRVKCSVYIVEKEKRNGGEVYVINTNRMAIQSYADFPLWLCPHEGFFQRLEVDSWESLKFRKQWFYTCINREKLKKITGSTWNDYRSKPWINKRPIRTFPRIWWIQVKTTVSNLWKRITGQENSIAISVIGCAATIVIGIIGIVVSIIVAIRF